MTATADTTIVFPAEIVRGEEVGHEGFFRDMEEYEEFCLSCWGDEARRELEEEYDEEYDEEDDEDDDERRDLDKNPITNEEIFEHITTTQEGSRTFEIWELDAENSARLRVIDDTQAVYQNDRGDYLVIGAYENGELYDIDIFYDEEDLNDYIEGLTD